ncbi:MAG TPA: outer membrane protein assembly factor BamD [Thermodesulfobacteriota bacterium]
MIGRSRAARLLAAGLLATLLPACASKTAMIRAIPPEELYARAEREIARKRWDQAAEEFKKLVDGYPYHRTAPYAELRLADMYFLDRKYPEAAATYEQFLKMRPTHPLAPYATYLLGSAHFHQRATYDRDPTQTRKAAEVFETLLEKYPGSEYADMARTRLAEARAELAAHELYIGDFYFRRDRYEAALRRYTKVWTKYPEQPAADEARVRAGECELRLARHEAARMTLSTVLHRNGDAEIGRRAAALLAEAGLEPIPASSMGAAPAEARSRTVAR